jgi:hypothetical protein
VCVRTRVSLASHRKVIQAESPPHAMARAHGAYPAGQHCLDRRKLKGKVIST